MSHTYFVTQVLPHEDTDDHEIIAKCGNLSVMHAPGAIQSFGLMLGIKEPALRISHVSDNSARLLGIPYKELLGKPLSSLMEPAAFESLKLNLASQNFKMINPVKAKLNGRPFDLILHRRNGVLFLECEKDNPAASGTLDQYREMSQRAITRMLSTRTVPELIQTAVDEIRAVTGYERILFYVFDEQYHGKVIGESRVPDIESFLGSRFPAWETPGPVRELYRTNFTRYLPHIYDVPSKVHSETGEETEGRLDMTNTILRATKQCHIDYLTNMGVGSSLTFSMTIKDRLWGFIVCHRRKPLEIPYTHRLLCEQVAGIIPDELWAREKPELYQQKLYGIKEKLHAAVKAAPNPASGLFANRQDFLELTSAEGGAIVFNNVVKGFGSAPADDQIRMLVQMIENYNLLYKHYPKGLVYTNNLSNFFAKYGYMNEANFAKQLKDMASGLLMVPITNTGRDYALWFRPEQVVVATWAGNPSKDTIFDAKYLHAPVNPRKSFEAWKANVVNRSEAWLPFEVEAATQFRDALLLG